MQNKETKKIELVHKNLQKSAIPYILLSIFIVVLLVVGFFVLKNQVNKVTYRVVNIGGTSYKLEVADTSAKREKGLSERDGLADKTGMLFDFETEGDWRMWMLQMRFPIDIAWLDKSGMIIYIKPSAQPGDYPEVYHAEKSSWYAVEVPAGTFEQLGVKVGDKIQLQ